MGFTNVAWESRDTEQIARDLTEGPGPASVGQAGAAWVRVADELAAIANDYQRVAEKLAATFESQAADRAAHRMSEFGQWLQALALSAAANGERAEEAAVANGVAVMAMPSVSAAVEARAERDMMNSLAAYHGAILTGRFAEIDEAVNADHAVAADVMYRYEQSCTELAQPWDQPLPPDATDGAALNAERDAAAAEAARQEHVDAGSRSVPAGVPPAPLAPFHAPDVKSSKVTTPASAHSAASLSSAVSPTGGFGGGYGPMAAAAARGDDNRQHESSFTAGALHGGGEPHAGVSDEEVTWTPTAHLNEGHGWTADVSWSTGTPSPDELSTPDTGLWEPK